MYLTVIFQIITKCGAHAQYSKSLFFSSCCFWINVTQINFENIKEIKIQRIISDSCFQLKSRFNVDARAPSIPLLNPPPPPPPPLLIWGLKHVVVLIIVQSMYIFSGGGGGGGGGKHKTMNTEVDWKLWRD